MENTKENVIKLLKAMRKVRHDNADHTQDDELAKSYLKEAFCLGIAIDLLTSQREFNDYYEIYKDVLEEEEENNG